MGISTIGVDEINAIRDNIEWIGNERTHKKIFELRLTQGSEEVAKGTGRKFFHKYSWGRIGCDEISAKTACRSRACSCQCEYAGLFITGMRMTRRCIRSLLLLFTFFFSFHSVKCADNVLFDYFVVVK